MAARNEYRGNGQLAKTRKCQRKAKAHGNSSVIMAAWRKKANNQNGGGEAAAKTSKYQ